jgi:hypothetical protein
MNLIRSIATEVFGLFVDDGNLAIAALVLVAAVAAAVKIVGLAPIAGGLVLAVGCLVILAVSVHRGARR